MFEITKILIGIINRFLNPYADLFLCFSEDTKFVFIQLVPKEQLSYIRHSTTFIKIVVNVVK